MADTKISALPATTTVSDTDEYVVAKAGASKKITGANLKAGVQQDYKPGGTDVAVADGGTGASTASAARTNLGLGTLATQNGTFSGTSSGTNTGDQTLPTDATIATTDVTTNNASTSKHGWLKKLDNNAAHYMDGTGAWSTPAGGGGGGGGAAVLGNFYANAVVLAPGDQQLTLTALTDTETWLDNGSGHSVLDAPPGFYSVEFDFWIDGWKWVVGDTMDLDAVTKPIILGVAAGGLQLFPFVISGFDFSFLGFVKVSVTANVILESPAANFLDKMYGFSINATALDGVGDPVHSISVTNVSVVATRLNDTVTY